SPRCSSTRRTFSVSCPVYPSRMSALMTRLTRGLTAVTASVARLMTPKTSSQSSPSIVVNIAVVSCGSPDSRTTRTASATAAPTDPSGVSAVVGATEKATSMPSAYGQLVDGGAGGRYPSGAGGHVLVRAAAGPGRAAAGGGRCAEVDGVRAGVCERMHMLRPDSPARDDLEPALAPLGERTQYRNPLECSRCTA